MLLTHPSEPFDEPRIRGQIWIVIRSSSSIPAPTSSSNNSIGEKPSYSRMIHSGSFEWNVSFFCIYRKHLRNLAITFRKVIEHRHRGLLRAGLEWVGILWWPNKHPPPIQIGCESREMVWRGIILCFDWFLSPPSDFEGCAPAATAVDIVRGFLRRSVRFWLIFAYSPRRLASQKQTLERRGLEEQDGHFWWIFFVISCARTNSLQ